MRLQPIFGAVLAFGIGVSDARAQSPNQCFYPDEWRNWKATPDAKAIYLRVGSNRFYRLELADACETLNDPGAHLITKLRGSNTYCSALDFDLSVAEAHGIPVPCIVTKMEQLTSSEAAALPQDLRP